MSPTNISKKTIILSSLSPCDTGTTQDPTMNCANSCKDHRGLSTNHLHHITSSTYTTSIVDDNFYPLRWFFTLLPSDRKHQSIWATTSSLDNSFSPRQVYSRPCCWLMITCTMTQYHCTPALYKSALDTFTWWLYFIYLFVLFIISPSISIAAKWKVWGMCYIDSEVYVSYMILKLNRCSCVCGSDLWRACAGVVGPAEWRALEERCRR